MANLIKPKLLAQQLPILIALIMSLLLFSIASRPFVRHTDERHYVYGGMHMLKSGDWLFPRTSLGEIRLKKPVLPYWFSAAGFKLMGINQAGSRLFWVLSAGIVLILTFHITLLFSKSLQTALLAELYLAGNPLFISSSVLTIPDMPLLLFMTLAVFALVRLIKNKTQYNKNVWLFWISIALATLAKGILPLVLVAFIILYLFYADRLILSKLLLPGPILTATCLALGWYSLAMYFYPYEFIHQFFTDQITAKISPSFTQTLLSMPKYALCVLVSFFVGPLIPLILTLKSGIWKATILKDTSLKLLLGWCLLVIVIFSFEGAVKARYLLPILPILSVASALLIREYTLTKNYHFLQKLNNICLKIIYILGFFLLLFAAILHVELNLISTAVLLFSSGILFLLSLSYFAQKNLKLATYLILLVPPVFTVFILFFIIAPLESPQTHTELANKIIHSHVPPAKVAFIGEVHEASLLRLQLGQQAWFQEFLYLSKEHNLEQFCIISTLNPLIADALKQKGFQVETLFGGLKERTLTLMLQSVLKGNLQENKDKYKKPAFFAINKACLPTFT